MTNSAKLTVRQFFERFPDEDACLEHIMNVRFGLRHVCRKCGKESTFHRLTNRPRAYSCAHCGYHVYPTAGSVFEDTRTPLRVWFYAIYLFVVTRNGVSGKELERALGVTYKTAWRMGQHIRMLMAKANGFEFLQGHIEADESYVGGRRSGGKRGRGAPGKTIVVGMKERGGRLTIEVAPNVRKGTLRHAILHKPARAGAGEGIAARPARPAGTPVAAGQEKRSPADFAQRKSALTGFEIEEPHASRRFASHRAFVALKSKRKSDFS